MLQVVVPAFKTSVKQDQLKSTSDGTVKWLDMKGFFVGLLCVGLMTINGRDRCKGIRFTKPKDRISNVNSLDISQKNRLILKLNNTVPT